MKAVAATTSKDKALDDADRGFLVMAFGGGGRDSACSAMKQHWAAGAPFPMETVLLDTEPTGQANFDNAINIAPTRNMVKAMTANPHRYGPACRAIVANHRYLLDGEVLGMGARTNRTITQAAFELHERAIIEAMQSAIHNLLRKGHFSRIQPVVLASTGGGTGSAAAILILDYFADTRLNKRMLLGLSPDIIAAPVLFAIDPYAHSLQQHNEVAPDLILSNAYATRVELAEYEKRGCGYEYIFHLGLGNDAGAVFSTIQQICETNGLLAWEWMANYLEFKGRAVDQLDFYKKTCRYNGQDVPENCFDPAEWPPYAAKP